MSTSDTTIIGTLSIRGAAEDTPSLRLSLSSQLKSADLRPGGMPPSAILIVRSMKDPLPGRIAPRALRVDADWERAVQNALSDVYRRAVRPVAGYIPPNASAVLFADEGEMLACLALDTSRGEVLEHWWWKMMLQPIHSQEGLKGLLCSRAVYLPAALRYLVDWGQAGTVANSLSQEEIIAIVSAMGREYGIANLGTDLFPVDKIEQKEIESRRTSVIHARSKKAIWEDWLPPVFESLEKEKRYFLGLGLALYHDPALVRANEGKGLSRHVDTPFADGKYTTEEQAESGRFEPGSTKERSGASVTELPSGTSSMELSEKKATEKEVISQNTIPDEPFSFDGSSKTIERKPQDKTLFADIKGASSFTIPSEAAERIINKIGEQKEEASFTRKPSLQTSEKALGEFEGRKNAIVAPKEPFFKEEKEALRENHPLSSTDEEAADHIGMERKLSLVNPEPAKPLQNLYPVLEERTGEEKKKSKLEDGVDTQLGGVLYLINLMKKLDLPECFEEEFDLVSSLGAWGVLEVIARALLGNKHEHLAGDPLWDALAGLNGHEMGKLPGEDFRDYDTFHLPSKWLKYITKDDGYHWASTHNRVRLWSKEYLLMDCPIQESEPETLVKEELMKYGSSIELSPGSFDNAPLDCIKGIFVEGFNPALIRWLEMVMPFIRYYLRQALGDEDESHILLCQGRLFITSTHVDVVMSMENISMPVRLAGLDQDPGWVTDFGRVVLFHFE